MNICSHNAINKQFFGRKHGKNWRGNIVACPALHRRRSWFRMRDSTLEYRLSIYHASVGDTGEFTCTTPSGRGAVTPPRDDSLHCHSCVFIDQPVLLGGHSATEHSTRRPRLSHSQCCEAGLVLVLPEPNFEGSTGSTRKNNSTWQGLQKKSNSA